MLSEGGGAVPMMGSKGFALVVAATEKWGIGKGGGLPWRLKCGAPLRLPSLLSHEHLMHAHHCFSLSSTKACVLLSCLAPNDVHAHMVAHPPSCPYVVPCDADSWRAIL